MHAVSYPYLHALNPFAVKFTESVGIRWYGLSYLAGFLAGYWIIRWIAARKLTPLKPELVSDFIFTVALGTIIGGRLGYCLLYSPDLLFRFGTTFPFWGVFAIHEGGMASHGGIVGILISSIIFARKHQLNGLHLADLTTLGGTIGIFFGRLANFINGELVGRACREDLPWAVKFPQDILLWPSQEPMRLAGLSNAAAAVGISTETWNRIITTFRMDRLSWEMLDSALLKIIAAVQDGNQMVMENLTPLLTARHPSQIYEALLEGLLLFVLLALAWNKPRKPGVITGIFFVFYAFVRIAGEQFRMPDLQIGFQLWGLTRGQWLSIGMLGAAIPFLIYCARRNVPRVGGWSNSRDSVV